MTGPDAAGLRIESLDKSFGDEQVLSNVDLTVEPGEFCVVIGPSGSGKSTLLKCIAGIHEFERGRIYVGDQDVTGTPIEDREMGFVFQEFEETLFPHMTVGENVAFGLRQADGHMDAAEIDRRVDEMLERLSISETKGDHPDELSGGQQQRVELARQLVRETPVMLLDDPLADLDYKLQKRMELDLRRLHESGLGTFVYVTHNQDQALKLADRLVVFNEGTIEQVGPPVGIYEEPANAFVNRFVGDSNLLGGTVRDTENGRVNVDTVIGSVKARPTNEVPTRSKVALLMRPEDLLLGDEASSAENAFEGVFEGRTYTGEITEFAVSLPTESSDDDPLFETIRPGNVTVDGVTPGDALAVGWERDAASCFDEISRVSSTTLEDLQLM